MPPVLELAATGANISATRLQSPAEMNEWDAWLRDDPAGHYRHASWWLESLRRLGITGTIINVRVNERIVGGAAILEFGFPRAGICIHSILHGPVIAAGEKGALHALVQAVGDHARQRSATLVQWTAIPRQEIMDFIASGIPSGRQKGTTLWKAYTSPDPFCSLPLEGAEEKLWEALSQSARRKIRKASAVKVRRGEAIADFREAHRTWQLSSDRKHFVVRPFDSVGYAMEHAVGKDMGMVLLASVDGKTAASIFVVWGGTTGHYVSGGFDPAFASYSCSYVLQWEAIKILRERGLSTYDLGNYSEDGVGQFKLSLGGRVQHIERSIAWIRRPILWRAMSVLMRPAVVGRLRRWARKNAGFSSME